MGQKCKYLTKNTNFGPNFAVIGPKILIFIGVSKSLGNHIMEKPSGQLVCIVFWSAWDQMGQNTGFWPKILVLGQIGRFWAKTLFLGGRWSKTFGIIISGNQWSTFSVLKHWPVRLQLAARDENVQFWPKNLDILGQRSTFSFGISIYINRAYYQYGKGYIQTTQKLSMSELWVFGCFGLVSFYYKSLCYKSP